MIEIKELAREKGKILNLCNAMLQVFFLLKATIP